MTPPSIHRTAPPGANCSFVECRWPSARRTCAWLSAILLHCSLQSADNHKDFFRSVSLESAGDLYKVCHVYDLRSFSAIARSWKLSWKCKFVPLCKLFMQQCCLHFGTLRNILQVRSKYICGIGLWQLMKKWRRARVRQSWGVPSKSYPKRKRLRDNAMKLEYIRKKKCIYNSHQELFPEIIEHDSRKSIALCLQ